MSDRELAAAVVRGERAAEERLLLRVFDVTRSVVSYALQNQSNVDDVVQDALLEILKSMKHYRGECSLETWARKVAVRTAGHVQRIQRRRKGLLFFLPLPQPVSPLAEDALVARELGFQLNGLLDRIPEKQRVALRLRFVHELSVAEIAQILDIPAETVRSRIKIGRSKLRKLIEATPELKSRLEEGMG